MIHQITLRIARDYVDSLVLFFEANDVSCVSFYEDETSFLKDILDENEFPVAEYFFVEGYTSVEKNIDFSHFALLHAIELPSVSVAPVELDSWISYYQSFSKKVGPFWINPETPQELSLYLEAATAFGSGEHPTTQGCLESLGSLASQFDFKRILDVGCGSGILAIAASKLWSNAYVLASDIDPESVRVSLENCAKNNVKIDVIESVGFDRIEGQFDLIVANILASPLKQMSSDMRCGDYLVLSGLLERQRNEVVEAYEHFDLIDEKNIDGWSTLIFKKK
jgi:ribosomal protein L11 methyltransferase